MVVKKWLSKMGTFLKEPFNRFGIVSCWIEFTSSPIPNLSCETSVLRCLTRSYTCSTRMCWCSIAFYPRHPFSRNHSFVSRGFLYTCRFLSRVTIILLLLSLRKEQLVTPEMKLSSFFLSFFSSLNKRRGGGEDLFDPTRELVKRKLQTCFYTTFVMDKLAQVSQASIYPSNNKVFYKLKTNFSRFLFHCGKNESKIEFELEICWNVRLIRFF